MSGHGTNGRTLLFTIGYEGKSIQVFLDLLAGTDVEVVVDVRETPLSRKAGFSRASLHETLAQEGIQYVSLRELGSPRELRERLRAGHDYKAFFASYGEHVRQQRDALAALQSLLSERTLCLMCYEADPTKCHRSHLAAELRRLNRTDLEVRHL